MTRQGRFGRSFATALLLIVVLAGGCGRTPEQKAETIRVIVADQSLLEHLDQYSAAAEGLLFAKRIVKTVLMLERTAKLFGGLDEFRAFLGEIAQTVVVAMVWDMVANIDAVRNFWEHVEAVEAYSSDLRAGLLALRTQPSEAKLRRVAMLAGEGDALLKPIHFTVHKVANWLGSFQGAIKHFRGRLVLCGVHEQGVKRTACQSVEWIVGQLSEAIESGLLNRLAALAQQLEDDRAELRRIASIARR